MSHLNVRINPEDEAYLTQLTKVWGLDRSAATRKALAYAASHIHKERKPKMQILEEYGLINAYSEGDRKSHKTRVKEAIKRKLKR